MFPNLVIIGAAKCGTTSLHNYLSLHPDIFMCRVTKEPNFFIKEKNWSNGLEWYESLFTDPVKIIGESSTSYTKYPKFQGIPERMHSYIPDSKIIYLVRDPIDQMISHYMESRATHYTKKSFKESFANLEDNYYVDCAKYYMQIEQFLKFYSKDNILILDSMRLRKERKHILKLVFNFLGVDDSFDHPDLSIEHRKSADKRLENRAADFIRQIPILSRARGIFPSLFSKVFERPVMDESLRSAAIELLRKDTEKLRAFSGQEFGSWSV